MPEGPEVESVKRNLFSIVVDKHVRNIELTDLSQKYPKYKDKQSLFDVFRGSRIIDIERKGKFLIWRFDIDPVILNHLGMSGKWLLNLGKSSYTHPKVIINLEGDNTAIFDDVRNFGQFTIYPDINEVMKHRSLKNLGIDGLEIPFDMETFLELLDHTRYAKKAIGELLLDQRVVAGIGNIYKSECLFRARIDPIKVVEKISHRKRKELGKAISETLHKALKSNGSTFGGQPYLLPSGEAGEAQKWHAVYGKEGEKCKKCNKTIIRLLQKDRSTFYCPSCQK
ncbi:MAG: bifunctional DNA-formamidopyrimidine glycosylase/DNA-(apurinic or apyrimidinic site) lyase [Candidatus Hodarchaeales archaeon]|jgi:formamidopyrimidine-DNA glycosylase